MFNKITRKKVTICFTKQPEKSDYMFNKIGRKKVTEYLTKQPEGK